VLKKCAFLVLVVTTGFPLACASREEQQMIYIDAGVIQGTTSRQILGQAVFYSWQAYTWDFEGKRTWPGAMDLFTDFGVGILGHYPGVGVITHDFHWKNLIGPLDTRKDPTPRQTSFDTPRFLEFGPDEYGRLLEEYRRASGLPVEGSIQVNIVSGDADEAADWVEYMNAPNDGSNPGGGIDWAAVRAANGHPAPYGIHYWELGNEPHFTASNIGQLTAAEYIARIRTFVPRMKERDPSIEVMGYVNPFAVGDPRKLGTATADIRIGPELTWSQAIIKDAGNYLDYVYFHWYGGWNDRRHDYEFLATSMHTGLIPLLDRLARDVNDFAPSDAARTRLRRVLIPEWNVYGGWAKPISKGSALQGAVAYSRTLHVFAARRDIYGAQHLGLAAPFPGPPMRLGRLFDVREGYITVKAKEDSSEFVGTALAAVAELWSRAFASRVTHVSLPSVPTFRNGVPVLDVTALRSSDAETLNILITNASRSNFGLQINLKNFTPMPEAVLLSVSSKNLSDNNTWEDRDRVIVRERNVPVGTDFAITAPAHSISAILMERAN
jgi:alpha-N-arabinofuranosidase